MRVDIHQFQMLMIFAKLGLVELIYENEFNENGTVVIGVSVNIRKEYE